MAVLSLAEFQNQIKIHDVQLHLSETTNVTTSYGGQSFVASRGVNLWNGTILCSTQSKDRARRIEAMVGRIRAPGNYFQYCPIEGKTPINYAAHDFSTVSTNGVQSAGYVLKLKGLPASFPISAGDYLSFAVNGIDRLHRVATDITASGTGTANVTLENPLPHGDLPGANLFVRFINPLMTAMYVPGSFKTGVIGLAATSGVSFNFIQATRV